MKKKRTDALLEQMLKMKPKGGEEDFWVFSLVMDDPEHPTWEKRLASMGTYEQAAAACVGMTHVLAKQGFPKTGIKIESYQGDGARRYLAETTRQEAAYRQERHGQDLN